MSKIQTLLVAVVAMLALPVLAQNPQGFGSAPGNGAPLGMGRQLTPEQRKQQYEEMRTRQLAFFTAEMGMTGDEASAFWVIYSDIQERRMKLNLQKRRAMFPRPDIKPGEKPKAPEGQPVHGFTQPPLPEDFDYSAALKTLEEIRKQEAALEEECLKRLSKVLPPEKIFKFYRADELFTRTLLNNFIPKQ